MVGFRHVADLFQHTPERQGYRSVSHEPGPIQGTDRLVKELSGGGWTASSWSPDEKTVIVQEYVSINESHLHLLDLASGRMTPLTPAKKASLGRMPSSAATANPCMPRRTGTVSSTGWSAWTATRGGHRP